MLDNLLQYNALQEILMKTIFVSIPEEFYWVMLTLILVGEFEYWKEPECKRLINKFDYIRVFLPTVVVALLTNILKYMGLDYGFFPYVHYIVFYVIIVLTNDVFGDASALKWMAKAFIFMMIGSLTIGLTEFLYIPFVLYGANLTMVEVDSNFLLYFMLSLPSRLLQYSILLYFVCRKRTLLKGKLLKPILSNFISTAIFSLFVAFNLMFLLIMYKVIVCDKVLKTVPFNYQIIIVIGVVLFPILNISGFVWSSYYMKNRETKDKKIATQKLLNLLNKIEMYTNVGNCGNIRWELNEIGIGIEEVADSLYRENQTDKHK